MITLDKLRIIARCDACHKPFEDDEIKLVMLPHTGVLWLPAWKGGNKLHAIGVICGQCIKEAHQLDEAIEVNLKNDYIIYHKLKDMEVAEEHGTGESTEKS